MTKGLWKLLIAYFKLVVVLHVFRLASLMPLGIECLKINSYTISQVQAIVLHYTNSVYVHA